MDVDLGGIAFINWVEDDGFLFKLLGVTDLYLFYVIVEETVLSGVFLFLF